MTTLLIDGVAIDASRIVCDPLPGKTTGPVVLRFQLTPHEVRPLESVGAIVFPVGGALYEGQFRRVATTKYSDGDVEYTYISEGCVTEHEAHIWERPLGRVLKWRPRLRLPRSSS
jgi:hypothetical protein